METRADILANATERARHFLMRY